ncbi:MAG: NERD domain-containing protein [Demequinaceae bacterium]|nr:NERD domain-containing protein [Demequinaceae bacterium]
MGAIEIKHKKKWGSEILFAVDPDGTTLGSMNLTTGEIDIKVPKRASEIATALNQWRIRNAEVEPRPIGAKPRDLAHNRPGAVARRQAKLAMQAVRRDTRAGVGMSTQAPIGVRSDETAALLGDIKGQERIARVLARLKGTGWRVIHSIPLPNGGDIDHLLVGEDGVVVISTKYHRGALLEVAKRVIYVNHSRTKYLDQARKEASEVSRLLSRECGFKVAAVPMVALVNGGLFQPRLIRSGTPKAVIVATNWDLPRALGRVRQGLADEEVQAIFEAARRSTTWQG